MKVLPLLLALFVSIAAPSSRANPEFDRWSERFAEEWIRLSPQFATITQYFSGDEQDALDRQLAAFGGFGLPLSTELLARRAALAQRGLEELKQFPDGALTATQRPSAALIRWSLTNATKTEFSGHTYVFEQFGGLQVGLLSFLTQQHPLRRERDIDNYLARLGRVAPLLDEGIVAAREAQKKGIVPPRFIIERTIEQIDGFLLPSARENGYVGALNQRIAALGSAIPEARRTAAVSAAEMIVAESVRPAYQRVRALLVEQLPSATNDAGVWRLPQGAEFYRQCLATYTTTSLSPDEVHAIGRREVARIEQEMDKLLRQLGYNDGSVKTRFEALQAATLPPMDPDPRPATLAAVQEIVRDAERRAASVFDLRPRAPVEVRREPAVSERTTAAHYTGPAPDGSQPGVYWIPLATFTPQTIWLGAGLRTTAYHEAVPGHHFQIAIEQELAGVPKFRRLRAFGFISAFGEGWALYSERLAKENGWYEGDLRGELGYLSAQLFRARRLVVDTGLHVKKWTREQAIEYGISPTEVERYIVWPGQACSYMIGQLRIVELREKAQRALGSKFSIKEYHNVVLRTGTVPLDVLAAEVDRWIAAQSK